jgi:hypothetical protein
MQQTLDDGLEKELWGSELHMLSVAPASHEGKHNGGQQVSSMSILLQRAYGDHQSQHD